MNKQLPTILAFLLFGLLVASCDRPSADAQGNETSSHADHPEHEAAGAHTGERHATASDWCGGHGLPESMCTKCNPELIEGFQAAGDWCEEHGFPESACPTCNPMTPPGSETPQAADWCVEHGVPESKCPLCNEGLAERFQAEGDWCAEHGFPESACPICNPQQVPVGSVLGSAVVLTPEAVAESEIRTVRARFQTSATSVSVPAEVRLNPDRLAHVSTLVPGQLDAIEVTVGDTVEAGDVLAELRSVELGQARAELSRADAMRNVAQQELARQRELREARINSERSLLEAELAYDVADAERDNAVSRLRVYGVSGGRGPSMQIQSPLDGVVIARHATRGENVTSDDTLFVVADRSQVWVIGRVYEQDMARVSTGMSATFEANAFPGRSWTGTVDYLGATLDEDTRSLPIRVELPNDEGLLRAGLFGTLHLQGAAEGGAMAIVPEDAVQTVNDQTVVFVPGEREGVFMARAVTVERYAGGNAQISAGLRSGDEVVDEGAFVLKSQIMRHALGEGCAH